VATIRKGTRGKLVNPDNRAAAALFDGARVRVLARKFFPDAVEVEFLDSGPNWTQGQTGEILLRYFSPDSKDASMRPNRAPRLRPGSADELVARVYWQESGQGDWAEAKVAAGDTRDATYLGVIDIEDARHSVFRLADGRTVAQHIALTSNSSAAGEQILAELRKRGSGRRILITDLRAALPEIDRATFDAALKALMFSGQAELMRKDNNPEVTRADERDAVMIAGNPRHLVYYTPNGDDMKRNASPSRRHRARGTMPARKFELGDYVIDKDGSREGVVSYVGDYDDYIGGYRYKVKEPDGTRKYWSETTMRLKPNHKGLLRRNADLPRPRPKIDTSLSRVRRIESEHTRRERPFDPEARYPRETKSHHFALNRNPELMDRSELGERMLQWHGGQDDPIYAVGSYYISDKEYPDVDVAQDALANLEMEWEDFERMRGGEAVMVRRQGRQVDLRKFAGYSDEDLEENAEDLAEILDTLREQMVEDYGDAAFEPADDD
jgi:hypothetical protein